ncbi:nucleotidyltransferase domain-containing protein [Photobacterium leiognathi]|nr:nucleotidyltransferase domain-containing protein [Photobacterium leiognathi]
MHIYAFGSICRGDIDIGSDVDMLIIANGQLRSHKSIGLFNLFV